MSEFIAPSFRPELQEKLGEPDSTYVNEEGETIGVWHLKGGILMTMPKTEQGWWWGMKEYLNTDAFRAFVEALSKPIRK